jgi:DNA polymerase III sliding clamp (beta) subunit (PCNA family)|tara:strand:+ start:1984 stop:2724 length:741 start_codon:yes stop_codon:yes gene_type:complete
MSDIQSMTLACGIAPLKEMVANLRLLTEECVFTITEEGIETSVVDSSHSCLLFSHLPAKTLTSIDIEGEVKIAVNLESLESALKLGDKSSVVKMTLGEYGSFLKLDVGGVKKSIRLLDIALVKTPPLPQIELDLQAEVGGSSFKKGVDAVKTVGEAAKLHYDGSIFTLSADSTMESVEAPLEVIKLQKGGDDAVATLFSTPFLTKMTKSLSKEVKISFGEQKPIQLESNKGNLLFNWFLAPRISDI